MRNARKQLYVRISSLSLINDGIPALIQDRLRCESPSNLCGTIIARHAYGKIMPAGRCIVLSLTCNLRSSIMSSYSIRIHNKS